MSLIINTWRDPYCAGFSPTIPKTIEINKPITVLVGCNGSGKTTLLNNIKAEMKTQKIPCHIYNNLYNNQSIGFDKESFSLSLQLCQSSEGEGIKLNIANQSILYKEFMKTGEYNDKYNILSKILRGNKEETNESSKVRVLLYDAVDSGLSLDGVIEIKAMFDSLINDSKEIGVDLYIIISANEYELCRDINCFDVTEGKYIKFTDYEDYRKFIIKSRIKKEKRIERQNKWRKEQRKKELKELEILKCKYYEDKLNLKHMSTFQKNNIKRDIEDFILHSRFLYDEEKKIEW